MVVIMGMMVFVVVFMTNVFDIVAGRISRQSDCETCEGKSRQYGCNVEELHSSIAEGSWRMSICRKDGNCELDTYLMSQKICAE